MTFLEQCQSDLADYAEYISTRLTLSMSTYGRITTDTLRAIEPTLFNAYETTVEYRSVA